jgi:hypothetical protein
MIFSIAGAPPAPLRCASRLDIPAGAALLGAPGRRPRRMKSRGQIAAHAAL